MQRDQECSLEHGLSDEHYYLCHSGDTHKDIITVPICARKGLTVDGLAKTPELRLQKSADTHIKPQRRKKEMTVHHRTVLKTKVGVLQVIHPCSLATTKQ